jgi:hypothetical protein
MIKYGKPGGQSERHGARADPSIRGQVPGDDEAENKIDLTEADGVEHRVQRDCRSEQ